MDVLISSSATTCCTSMPSPAEPATAPAVHSLLHELAMLHARLEQTPLSVAVFLLPPAANHRPEQREQLLTRLHARMLSCDTLFPLAEDRCVLLLPGAGLFKAQALLEALLRAMPDEGLTVGIAAGGDLRHQPETLLEQATIALHEALAAGVSLRAFRDAVHPLRERKTLVRSDEKRFLFSGGD